MSMFKTKEVAKELGIHPKTVQRWLKNLNYDLPKNQWGHYVFRDQDVALLKEIKTRLNRGFTIDEVMQSLQKDENDRDRAATKEINKAKAINEAGEINEAEKTARNQQNGQPANSALRRLEEQLKQLEFMVSQKAGDVVMILIQQQRNELEEANRTIKRLEERIIYLENTISHRSAALTGMASTELAAAAAEAAPTAETAAAGSTAAPAPNAAAAGDTPKRSRIHRFIGKFHF